MTDWQGRPRVARLVLIGGFRLTTADGAAVAISSRRGRALLAYLCLAPDRAAARERLCGLLWSDRGEAQARSSLRQVLLELRDALSAMGLDILRIERERIGLDAQQVSSDIGDLEAALADGDAAALIAALGAMGRHRLLEDLEIGGLFQDWLEQARSRFERASGDGVLSLLTKLEAAGDWSRARAIADAWLPRDPLDEAVVAAAIRADAALGAGAAAHRRYRTLQADLARELGVAPGTAVQAALALVGSTEPPAGARPGGSEAPRSPTEVAPQSLPAAARRRPRWLAPALAAIALLIVGAGAVAMVWRAAPHAAVEAWSDQDPRDTFTLSRLAVAGDPELAAYAEQFEQALAARFTPQPSGSRSGGVAAFPPRIFDSRLTLF